AGAGGSGTSGGAGGATTFGTSPNFNCNANGGSGGLNMALGTTVTYQAGGAGGTVTACVPGCKLQSTGGPGEYAVRASGSISVAGSGGNSHLGGGGYLAGTGAGGAGTFGGGGGGANSNTTANNVGGAGGAGVIRITEYKSRRLVGWARWRTRSSSQHARCVACPSR